MTVALSCSKLRESATQAFSTNSRSTDAEIKFETAPAFLALLTQGALPRSAFLTFTGIQSEDATDHINRLINLDIVINSPSDLLALEVALPDGGALQSAKVQKMLNLGYMCQKSMQLSTC
ncbi:hypothetical protein ACTACG_12740 [Pseudomonas syringae]|uniref:hypothetical protein n=1 Tax=Pseudomonas syringae TaxID=317 RepID=UPI001268F2D0|nr:hypothetical protein [Pseudomonas syringae]